MATRILDIGQQLGRRMKSAHGVDRVAFVFTGGDVAHAHAHVVPLHDKTDITSARYIVEVENVSWDSSRLQVPRAELERVRDRLAFTAVYVELKPTALVPETAGSLRSPAALLIVPPRLNSGALDVRSMVRSISADTLMSASAVLERDAALLRRSMQSRYDAADPIPGVEREKKLAALLRQAAGLPSPERSQFLAATLTATDLKEIDLVCKGLGGTTVHEDPRELAARATASRVLSELLHELRAVLKT